MIVKPRHIHGRQQQVVEEALGVGDTSGEGVHADSAERAVASDDDRRHRWVEFHDVRHPRLDVTDEVAVDEVKRCPTISSHSELQRARTAGACEERVADARWRRFDGVVRRRRSLGSNWSSRGNNRSSRGNGDVCRRRRTVGSNCRIDSARVRAAAVTVSVAVVGVVVAAPVVVTLLLLGAAIDVVVSVSVV